MVEGVGFCDHNQFRMLLHQHYSSLWFPKEIDEIRKEEDEVSTWCFFNLSTNLKLLLLEISMAVIDMGCIMHLRINLTGCLTILLKACEKMFLAEVLFLNPLLRKYKLVVCTNLVCFFCIPIFTFS